LEQYGRNLAGNPAENYEKYFVPAIGAPVAASLIKAAALRSGERVLDVGCGTGVVARLAAEITGGRVAGLDANPGMLAVARSATPARTSIDWYEADAAAIPLPDESFDAVLCQMTLQFIQDKESAVREMHRVLVPGGRVVLNTPGRMQPFFAIMETALARHLSPEAGGFVRAVFSLHDPGELQKLLTAGGFRNVNVRTTPVSLKLPPPGEFLWQYVYSTPLANVAAHMEDDRLASLEREVVNGAKHLANNGGVPVPQDIVVATGRK